MSVAYQADRDGFRGTERRAGVPRLLAQVVRSLFAMASHAYSDAFQPGIPTDPSR
jgi:hypothetical protein